MAHKKIYIIADLHLCDNNNDMFELFKKFLNKITSSENTLYILGDFFNYWIGDDQRDEFNHKVVKTLRNATDNGLEIFFMRGNRDFLVGRRFAKYSGVKLIKDPYYMTVGTNKILLAHGDRMCTDDISYQRYRKYIARNPILYMIWVNTTLAFRERIANNTREKSKLKNYKFPDIDVTQKGIDQFRKDCNIVIHGHTHKMNIHQEDGYTRYVLGDWFKKGSYITIDGDEISLVKEISL